MASTINANNTTGLVSTADTSGILQLQTNGTTAVTVDDSQRVAFVAGTAALPAITTTGDTNTGIFFPAADTIAFAEGGVEAMRLDSSGNLGLGVTPSSWATYKAFDIGYAGNGLHSTGQNDLNLASNVYYNSGYKYAGTGKANLLELYDGSYLFKTAASGTAGNAITFTQAMTLDASGSLTIGGLTATRLEVNLTENDKVELNTVDSTNTARNLVFSIGDTERCRIDTSGNLLVGKTSADNSVAGVWVYNQSGTNARLNLAKTASGTTNGIANYHSGTYVGGVDYSNTATSFPTSSDIRLKKDIVDASSASTKIDQIRVVSHGWKHDDEIVEFGVIAQELYAIAPQAVNAGDDGEEIDKTWGVDYSKLVPILIKAHQEQQTLIESLTQRITTLEGAQP